jgi:TIR domain-containing protein
LSTHNPYIGFFSYSRFDNRHSGEWLTGLRAQLENEVSAQTGNPIKIFQDVEGISWGEQWHKAILSSLDATVFLIPVITPHYFTSAACREEIERFVSREEKSAFDRFILPLYFINCAQLNDPFTRSADRIAQVVNSHQYEDLRALRSDSLDSPQIRNKVISLAEVLLKRFREYQTHLLASPDLSGTILVPGEREKVTNRTVAAGELSGLPSLLDCWVVVEASGKWHPQIHIQREHHWRGFIRIGRKEKDTDKGTEFEVHLMAVTPEVTNAFQRYLEDGQKRSMWRGLSRPYDVKILATRRVTKDDSASNFAFLNGSYKEYDAAGWPSGGIVTVRTIGNKLTAEARNTKGQTEWISDIEIDEENALGGHGRYRYAGRDDNGEHHVTIEYPFGNLNVQGKPSIPGRKEFTMRWQKYKPNVGLLTHRNIKLDSNPRSALGRAAEEREVGKSKKPRACKLARCDCSFYGHVISIDPMNLQSRLRRSFSAFGRTRGDPRRALAAGSSLPIS